MLAYYKKGVKKGASDKKAVVAKLAALLQKHAPELAGKAEILVSKAETKGTTPLDLLTQFETKYGVKKPKPKPKPVPKVVAASSPAPVSTSVRAPRPTWAWEKEKKKKKKKTKDEKEEEKKKKKKMGLQRRADEEDDSDNGLDYGNAGAQDGSSGDEEEEEEENQESEPERDVWTDEEEDKGGEDDADEQDEEEVLLMRNKGKKRLKRRTLDSSSDEDEDEDGDGGEQAGAPAAAMGPGKEQDCSVDKKGEEGEDKLEEIDFGGDSDGNDSDDARAVDALRKKGKSKRKHLEAPKPMRISKASKRKKRAGEPKRALSAYMFFCKEMREEKADDELAGLSATDVLRQLGAMWSKLEDGDKTRYNFMASQDKKRYAAEMAVFAPAPEKKAKKKKKRVMATKKGSKRLRQSGGGGGDDMDVDDEVEHKAPLVPLKIENAAKGKAMTSAWSFMAQK